jgi:hypothetical protein
VSRLNSIMLNVVMPNVIMLNVVMPNVIMLNVVMPNVIMLRVRAPSKSCFSVVFVQKKIIFQFSGGRLLFQFEFQSLKVEIEKQVTLRQMTTQQQKN